MFVLRLVLAFAWPLIASLHAVAQPLTIYPAWATCSAGGFPSTDLSAINAFQELPNGDVRAERTRWNFALNRQRR